MGLEVACSPVSTEFHSERESSSVGVGCLVRYLAGRKPSTGEDLTESHSSRLEESTAVPCMRAFSEYPVLVRKEGDLTSDVVLEKLWVLGKTPPFEDP